MRKLKLVIKFEHDGNKNGSSTDKFWALPEIEFDITSNLFLAQEELQDKVARALIKSAKPITEKILLDSLMEKE